MKSGNLRPSFSFLLALVAFLLGIGGAINLASRQVSVPVPKRDLPAYYQVKKDDLVLQNYPANAFTSTPLSESQIIGHYTLVAVPKRKPFIQEQEQLIEPSRIANTVAITIPATPNLTLGGSLKAGDSVDILIMPKTETGKPPAKAVSFSNILVLSVKSGQPSGAVVIALPLDRRNEFIQASASATLWLTRKF